MKDFRVVAVGFALVLAGCASTSVTSSAHLDAMEVIERAAAAAPRSVAVTVELPVVATGTERDIVFLNSQADYRDPRNITVALLPSAQEELRQRYGQDLLSALKGKTFLVSGGAKRVTVWFFSNGVRTDKYYYQTHISVRSGKQLVER